MRLQYGDGRLLFRASVSAAVWLWGAGICLAQPSSVSVTPSSTASPVATQTFYFVASSPSGAGYLDWSQILFNYDFNVGSGCLLQFGWNSGTMGLMNDAATQWVGGGQMGQNLLLENSQCRVNLNSASTSPVAGNQRTLTVTVQFLPAFSGALKTYMWTADQGAQNSGWHQLGTWTAYTAGPPTNLSVTPSSTGSPVASQTFSFTTRSPNGAGYLSWSQIIINYDVDAGAGCLIQFSWDGSTMGLMNDQGTAWVGGGYVGQALWLENSQCRVYLGSASISPSAGYQRTLTVSIEFKAAFIGPQKIFMWTQDWGGMVSPWQQLGTWTAFAAQSCAPVQVSVNPDTGGAPVDTYQAFTYRASSCNGHGYIPTLRGLLTSNPIVNGYVSGGSPSCHVQYFHGNHAFVLITDNGQGWVGWAYEGSTVAFENGQCRLNMPGTLGVGSANNLDVTFNLSFKAAFTGVKDNDMLAVDRANQSPLWQKKGTWTVTAPQTITTMPSGLSLTVDGSTCTSPCTFQWTQGTSHTIVATSPQLLGNTNYWFSYWSDGGTQSHTIVAPAAGATFTATMVDNPLQALTSCLSSAPSPPLPAVLTCTLPTGTHTVTTPIIVGRSDVTVTGGSSIRSQTVLVRSPSNTAQMMLVDSAAPLKGITIQNLTFCGNSALFSPHPSLVCPTIRVMQVCGACADLAILHADTGAYISNPFLNPGQYSVTIANTLFEDAAGHAISIFPEARTPSKKVNDIYITGSAINRSAVTGILTGSNGIEYQRRTCDGAPGFKDDPALFSPRNILIKESTFDENNTGAIGMGAARWVGLRDNIFTGNYRKPQAGNIEGGTVFFNQCTDTIEIVGNRMTGPLDYDKTQGLELWGRDITVKDHNSPLTKFITGYGNEGIGLNSVFNAKVINNNVYDNDRNFFSIGYRIGGILAWTSPPWDPPYCAPVPRDVDVHEISGNISKGQAYGVHFGNRGRFSRNIIKRATIIDNNLAGNNLTGIEYPIIRQNKLVGLETYSGPPGTPVLLDDPDPQLLLPTALPVDTVSVLRPKCTTPGSTNAETFIFSASDAGGASNIDWIQGVFSIAGNDDTGANGPDAGAQGCHFYYDRATNKIYLDGANGGSQWIGSKVLSTVGTLSNGYCTIDIGSSSYLLEPTASPTVLTLMLNIAFPTSTSSVDKKHMYAIAHNLQDLWSGGNAQNPIWTYWGWWATQ